MKFPSIFSRHYKTFKHKKIVKSIAFSPDSKWLVSGQFNGEIIIWSLETKKPVRIIKAHKKNVDRLAFSPSGDVFSSISRLNEIRFWDIHNGELVGEISEESMVSIGAPGSGSPYDASFFPDEKQVVTLHNGRLTGNNLICVGFLIWSFPKLSLEKLAILYAVENYNFQGHGYAIAVSPDGKIIAASFNAAAGIKIKKGDSWVSAAKVALAMFNVDSDECRNFEATARSIAFSPNGERLLIISSNGPTIYKLRETEIELIKKESTLELSGTGCADFSPDSKFVANAYFEYHKKRHSIAILNSKNEEILYRLKKAHKEHIGAIAFSPDGNYLATGSRDKTVKLWDWQFFLKDISTPIPT